MFSLYDTVEIEYAIKQNKYVLMIASQLNFFILFFFYNHIILTEHFLQMQIVYLSAQMVLFIIQTTGNVKAAINPARAATDHRHGIVTGVLMGKSHLMACAIL